ncbi:MAG: hypothetical protein ACYDEO_00995 [Aggregatilineales bacterium]
MRFLDLTGQPARSFTTFIAARDEAAISRLYGGIHFRMDIENGTRQGQCVGQHLINNIHISDEIMVIPQGHPLSLAEGEG